MYKSTAITVQDVECDVLVSATQDRPGQENLVAGISPRHREMDPGEETVNFVTVLLLCDLPVLSFSAVIVFLSLFLHSLSSPCYFIFSCYHITVPPLSVISLFFVFFQLLLCFCHCSSTLCDLPVFVFFRQFSCYRISVTVPPLSVISLSFRFQLLLMKPKNKYNQVVNRRDV